MKWEFDKSYESYMVLWKPIIGRFDLVKEPGNSFKGNDN